MNLRTRIILLAILPAALGLLLIGWTVRWQATTLADEEHAALESAFMASKQTELQHYVLMGRSAIRSLYDSGRDDAATREAALAVLSSLEFGQDGYFFVYDLHGNNLMHARQPELVGRNLWDLRDPSGNATIQALIRQAQAGGGYVNYQWQRPSTGRMAAKLGYVLPLTRWGWLIGTGIYLDDVDKALGGFDTAASGNISRTTRWISFIAMFSLVLVVLAGLAVNLREQRSSEAKLRTLTHRLVASQETERSRIARELHDGIGQMLVATKLQLESAVAALPAGPATPPLATALTRLQDTLGEIRRISQDLRPAMLDDLGLPAALEQLARDFGTHSGLQVRVSVSGGERDLPESVKTALFRIAQEALTNVERHARGRTVAVQLDLLARSTRLRIRDDGVGFDLEQVEGDARRGLGLRNMRERLDALGGELRIESSAEGSCVDAITPWPPIQA